MGIRPKKSEARKRRRLVLARVEQTLSRERNSHPGMYRPIFADQVGKLPAPVSIHQIADFFGVVHQTIHDWRKKHPAFDRALLAARARVDDKVERSLYHRARGYHHPAVKILPPRRGSSKPLVVPYTERYPPDTGALTLWLKSRRPDEWREQPGEGLGDGQPVQPVKVVIEFKDARKPKKEK